MGAFFVFFFRPQKSPSKKSIQKTAVGLNDGGRESKPLSFGGAFCPLKRGQQLREQRRGV